MPKTIDNQDVVARAYRKIMDGRKDDLTREESRALKKHEKDKEERIRWDYYGSIPQKHWRTMSGRQAKVINEQAQRYDIPFSGATVDLPSVVRKLHDFLADNKHKLARDDDEMLMGASSPALERYREERAALAKLDRLQREGQLINRDLAHQSLGKIASILRDAGDTLNRQFGAGAADILHSALDDAKVEIDRSFGGDSNAV
jgi:hypothetical protein